MPTYYDDNFGCYEIDGPEDVEFYHQTQRQSRRKKCQGCGRMVRIYKRTEFERARADLSVWVQTMKSAIPTETRED